MFAEFSSIAFVLSLKCLRVTIVFKKARRLSPLMSKTIHSSGFHISNGCETSSSNVRAFSVISPRRIMELTGSSQEQLDVREAVAKICSSFPNGYWAERDESGVYPHELHAALAKNGWIGIALPEDLGGAGLGIS